MAFHGGAAPAVSVDLSILTAQETGQGLKTISGVENLSGTTGSDTLAGNDQANFIWGYTAGNDSLSGRGGDDLLLIANGAHTVDGGEGRDALVASYAMSGAVHFSLWAQGSAWNTGQGSVNATGIENLSGTVFNDTLAGDNGDNVLAGNKGADNLWGGGGNDVILGDGEITLLNGEFATLEGPSPAAPPGEAGDDYMTGNEGDDFINGGGGRDIAAFHTPEGAAGSYRLVDATGTEAGVYFVERFDGAVVETVFRIQLTANGAFVTGLGSAADQGTDFVTNVEQLHFLPRGPFDQSRFLDVRIETWANADTVTKWAHVNGSIRSDFIDLAAAVPQADSSWNLNADGGDLGADTLLGHDGHNWMRGNSGDDSLSGRGGDDYLMGDAGADVIDGGAGRDTVGYELAAGTTGTLRVVAGFGVHAGKQIVQRLDGSTVEDLFLITQVSPGQFTVQGLNSAAHFGTDTVTNTEGLTVYVSNGNNPAVVHVHVDLALYTWVNSDAHHVGVNGTNFADTINSADHHQDKDASWMRFINGNGGDDSLVGAAGVDQIYGDAGNDTLSGGGGNDGLTGRTGNDHLIGGSGDDVANYEIPASVTGQISAVAGPTANSVILRRTDGTTTEDLFLVTQQAPGVFTVQGLGSMADHGTDTLYDVEGVSLFGPGLASGFYLRIAPSAWVYDPNHHIGVDGSIFGDVINLADHHQDKDASWGRFVNANSGDDHITGQGFNESLNGNAGNDTILAGGGNDTVTGGVGDDYVDLGEGHDRVFAGQGADTLFGGAGDDVLILANNNLATPRENGDDRIDGGEGFDVLSFWSVTGPVNFSLWNSGPQTTGFGTLTVSGVEGVEGGRGNDNLHGNNEDNWLSGGFGPEPTGNDNIFANGGDDVVLGRDGDDYLAGGDGDDYVDGGVGRDVAAFYLPQGTPGTLRAVAGTGADAGSVFVERVDGSTVEQVFKVTPNGAGGAVVAGLGSAASSGTDSVAGVEDLHFMVPQDPFNPDQFVNVLLTPQAWVYEPSHHVGVDGSEFGDVIRSADYHQDKDPSWTRVLNGRNGNDTIQGSGSDDYLNGGAGDDSLSGGAGRDIANYELAAGSSGQLRSVAGSTPGTVIVQRVDGSTVEDVFLITRTGADTFTVTGMGPAAGQGTDTLAGVEGASFYIQNAATGGTFVNLTPSTWVNDANHHVGVNGTEFGELIDAATYHQDQDPSWTRFMNGGGGDDTVVGSVANDQLAGDAGADSLAGEGGDDYLTGGAGNDILAGGAGRDIGNFDLPAGTTGQLRSVAGVTPGTVLVQRVDGPTVEDVFLVTQTGDQTFTVTGLGSASGQGTDTVTGVEGLSFYIQNASTGGTFINLAPSAWVFDPNQDVGVNGTPFGDVINLADYHQDRDATWDRFVNADNGNDTVIGTALNEGLNGEGGNDSLQGGAGNDFLQGGAGNDIVDGGEGANDVAQFTLASGTVGQLVSVLGQGAEAGKVFVVRNHNGVSERVFELTYTGAGPTLEVTVTGLNSAAFLGTDVVRNVEQLHFGVQPFNQATFLALRLTANVQPLENGGFVNGTILPDTIDLAAIHPTASASIGLNANGGMGDDLVAGHDGFNDLSGALGNDTLLGRGGDDLLRGGAGADRYDGGAGFDRISFYDVTATQGVEADLATGVVANDGFGNAETFTGIEGLGGGTRFVDKFYGDEGGNLILAGSGDIVLGRGGDDTFIMGGAGSLVDGGAGRDSLRFDQWRTVDQNGDGIADEQSTSNGVHVNLALRRVIDDGFGQGGDVVGIEILAGTNGADTLVGDGLNNELYGNAGSDSLSGGIGDDRLFGGLGNDTLVGGSGGDTAIFAGARSDYTVTATATGYRVVDNNLANGDEGTDELSGIELLAFADALISLQPGVSIAPFTLTQNENAGGATTNFNFVVTRGGDLNQGLTLPYVVTPSGVDGADADDIVGFNGTAMNGTVTFAPGQSIATITIQVVGDAVIEAQESFTVTLQQPATGTVDFARQQATGTINNDDNMVNIPPEWQRAINFGDPHIVTLDGLKYEMQGVGEFTLVRSTSGDINVQVRTAAVNAYASEISAVATSLAGHKVHINADGVLLNGVSLDLSSGVRSFGADGSISRYSQNGTDGWLVVFADSSKAAMIVLDMGDRLDVTFAAAPERAGQFQGLLGNFDGNAANDLTPKGATQPLVNPSFDQFYDVYVDSWRITQGDSLFHYVGNESTATFTDLAFPPAPVTLDLFPVALVQAAEEAATAAGITDPALRDAAIKDFLLTGDSSFLTSGTALAGTVEATADATPPAPAGTTITAVGVGANVISALEGQSGQTVFTFTVYRTSGESSLTVNWSVAGATFDGVDGAASAGDFSGPLSGTVTFAAGEKEKTVQVLVKGDTEVEGAEGFRFSIQPPTGTLVIAGGVDVKILNDDVAKPNQGLTLSGSAGADVLNGTAFSDQLEGAGGNDTLVGAGGDDLLRGGDGFDRLFGGAGNDTFVFGPETSTVQTKLGAVVVDVIADFATGDRIDLSAIDANGSAAGDQAFSFVGAASGKGIGQLSFNTFGNVDAAEAMLGLDIDGLAGKGANTPVTVVFGNTDADADPEFVIVLLGYNGLSSSDFLL